MEGRFAATEPLQAVLFDMDGLLVDTEPQWFAAERRTVADLGATWGAQQAQDLLGSNWRAAAQYMTEYAGSDRDVEDVMGLLLTYATEELEREVAFRPGAVELIGELTDAGVPMALVTSSVRVHVDAVLSRLPGRPFGHVVTADDVTNFKPHPEPYSRALELLSVSAEHVVVLEDSPIGVAAAEAAGCYVVAVPSLVAIQPAPRRAVRQSLVGLTLASLNELVSD